MGLTQGRTAEFESV